METRTFSDDIRRYVGLLRHWAWLLILAAVLAGTAAYLLTKQMTPVYQASTTMLINEAPSTKSTDYSSIMTSERLAQTYAKLITTQPVLNEVANRLQQGISGADLKDMISVSTVRDTQLLSVKVRDTIPARAADIANTW